MRPQDGNGDGTSICDLGAIERAMTQSSTYVVNLFTQDLPDFAPGDDICDAIAESAGSQCTLRAAVMEANAKPGPDFIEFVRDDNNDNTLSLTRSNPGGALWGDLDITEQLWITGISEFGRPLTTIVGAMNDRLFDVQTPVGHQVRLFDLRLFGGETTGYGGGARLEQGDLLYVDGVELAGNQADLGGGALASLSGTLSVLRADVHDNQADTNGGALYSTGRVAVAVSSFTANTTDDAALPEVVVIDDNGSWDHQISKVTISGNSGGVRADDAGSLKVQASTIVDNGGYGLRNRFSGQLTLLTTIIANHGIANCGIGPAIVANTDNYNFFGGVTCPAGASNQFGDPQLSPQLTLYDYSRSRVRLPLPGSPVVDAIPIIPDSLRCNEFDTDQLNAPRPRDGDGDGIDECDIGAREVIDGWNVPPALVVNVFDVDQVDAVPGDSICDTSLATIGYQCTLRAAAMEANAFPGANVIQIPAGETSVLTIAPVGGDPAASGDLQFTESVEVIGGGLTPAERPQVLASHGDRIFALTGSNDYRIANLVLSGGSTTAQGGAIRSVGTGERLLERLELTGNSADDAGGALEIQSGEVVLLDSDLHANTSPGDGTAVTVSGDLTIERSSVRGNFDSSPGTPGEAIRIESSGSVSLRNSTVSGNQGDGVGVDPGGSLVTRTTTIAANAGLGVRFQPGGGVEYLVLHTTILTGNAGGGCVIPSGTPDTLTTNRYNLSQDSGCDIGAGDSNLVLADAGLTPLQVDPTLWSAFHIPLPGSAAVDNGHPVIGGVGCPAEDQHGLERPVDGDGNGIARCDIGSLEAPLPVLLFSDGFED
jgi:predicted outer membrane repeat protein